MDTLYPKVFGNRWAIDFLFHLASLPVHKIAKQGRRNDKEAQGGGEKLVLSREGSSKEWFFLWKKLRKGTRRISLLSEWEWDPRCKDPKSVEMKTSTRSATQSASRANGEEGLLNIEGRVSKNFGNWPCSFVWSWDLWTFWGNLTTRSVKKRNKMSTSSCSLATANEDLFISNLISRSHSTCMRKSSSFKSMKIAVLIRLIWKNRPHSKKRVQFDPLEKSRPHSILMKKWFFIHLIWKSRSSSSYKAVYIQHNEKAVPIPPIEKAVPIQPSRKLARSSICVGQSKPHAKLCRFETKGFEMNWI
jgi:hypothetical protein